MQFATFRVVGRSLSIGLLHCGVLVGIRRTTHHMVYRRQCGGILASIPPLTSERRVPTGRPATTSPWPSSNIRIPPDARYCSPRRFSILRMVAVSTILVLVDPEQLSVDHYAVAVNAPGWSGSPADLSFDGPVAHGAPRSTKGIRSVVDYRHLGLSTGADTRAILREGRIGRGALSSQVARRSLRRFRRRDISDV